MADRLQYPILPSYLQQQSQQQPQDPMPNFSDNSRMWSHMQQMRSHPQDPHPQLADLFRNQPMVRLPQGQPQPQSQQFSSAIGMPQMPASQGINGAQPPFQDLSANQPQPSHMSSVNFNSMSNAHLHMNSVSQSRNNTLLQNFSRPYDLPFAQNQHPQNGTLGFGNKPGMTAQLQSTQQPRDQQQHLQPTNHASPADMFASPTMQHDAVRRPSPSHQPLSSQHMQSGMMSSTQQNMHNPSVASNPMGAFASRPLQDQAVYLRSAIRTLDTHIATQKATLSDADPMTKARIIAALVTKKETMNKLLNEVGAAMQAQSAAGQGQMAWMTQQPGPSQSSFDAGSIQRNQSSIPQTHIPQQPNNTAINSNSLVQQAQPGQLTGQNPLGLQPTSSLQGNLGSPFPSQATVPTNPTQFNVSSALMQQQPIQRQKAQHNSMPNPLSQMLPPLEKARFEAAFKNFCNNKQIKIDHRLLNVNNRLIDLHMLHTLVMREGGEAKVHQKDLWSIIGGRMGFVQFPGSDTEPGRSGPGIAQQLEHIYKQYLAIFDRAYIANVLDSRIKNGSGPLPFNPSQLNLMISMADQTVPQLRSQGLSDQMVQFIETHRNHLQRLRQERDGIPEGAKPGLNEQNATPLQVNGNVGVSAMNPGLRQSPFVQPGPQSSLAQQGGHNVDARQHPTGNRPGREQVQTALALIAKARQETINSNSNRPLVIIPAEQRIEYNTLLDQLHRQAAEIENKLAMLYIYTRKEEFVRRIIIVIVTVQQQRNMLSSGNPRFFVTLDNLRVMHQQMQQAADMCAQLFTALSLQKPLQPGPRPLNQRNPVILDSSQLRPLGAPNQLHPSPNLQPPQQPNPQQPTPAQVPLHPPLKKMGPVSAPTSSQTTVSTPSPAPISTHTPGPSGVSSATTPLNHAPSTPALPPSSSPPAPKSPKGKIPKSKQAVQTPKRRPSKPVPPAVTCDPPVTPSSNFSIKRPREEEDSNPNTDSVPHTIDVANEPSPPKRMKTEWETEPSEELKGKTVDVDKLESVDDANSFLEQMSELLKHAADNEGQESALPADLSETLGMILKGCATLPEASDNGLAFGEAIGGRESPPSIGFKDAFEEFIDYSFGQQEGQIDDEDGSKVHTPDLVSSSTNLSPESNADGENTLLATMTTSLSDIKKEDQQQDLRLGLWKEFDGGESAYYQPFEWKWDGPMPVLEQSWAVSTS